MKFIVSLILIALLSFTVCLYFPWWSIAIVAFVAGAAIPQSWGMSFLSGFIALFLLWAGLSFWISNNNDHILAHRISMMFFKVDSPLLLILASGFTGGLVAGLSAMTGSFLRRRKRRPTTY